MGEYYQKIDKAKYNKQITDIENFLSLVKKIKPTPEWLKEMSQDLQQIIADIEQEKGILHEQMSRRVILKRAAQIAAGTVALGGVSAGLIYLALIEEASKLPKNTADGLAILISEPRNMLEKFGSYFVKAYTSRIELAFGFRANYIFQNATSSELFKMLYDPTIQNIAILGHGHYLSWSATDKDMDSSELWNAYEKNRSDKKGWFLKHTCAYFPEPVSTELLPKPELYKKLEKMWQDIENILDPKFKLEMTDYSSNQWIFYIVNNYSNEKIPSEKLPPHIRKKISDLNEEIREIYKNPNNLQSYVFGVPFFKSDHISYWMRITSPIDFMINPFADKKYTFDKFSSKVHGFVDRVIRYGINKF